MRVKATGAYALLADQNPGPCPSAPATYPASAQALALALALALLLLWAALASPGGPGYFGPVGVPAQCLEEPLGARPAQPAPGSATGPAYCQRPPPGHQ